MIAELTETLEKLHIVAGAIQSQCDGAKQIDGVGFNKFDAEFFRNFVYSYEPSFSQMLSAHNSLKKYKKQIQSLGYTELFESIKFDSELLRKEYIENCKDALIEMVENATEKQIPSKGKSVKSIDIGGKKWIWDLYKDDSVGKSWFKENGLSVYKNDYLGGVWQVTKWFDIEVSPSPTKPTTPSKFGVEIKESLVSPADVVLNYADKLLPYQVDHVKFLIASLQNFNAVLDASDTGCHKKGTEILMFDGTKKKVEDIVVGDKVMDWRGNAQVVTQLKRGREQMFEIKPVKGDSFIVNKNHILTLIDSEYVDSYARELVIDIRVSDYIQSSEDIKIKYIGFRIHLNSSRQVILEDRFQFSVLPLEEDDYYGFSLDGDGRFLLGDFTVTHNTGKTFSALACAKELGLTPVILTPKAVVPSWVRACSKHFGIDEYFVTNYESIKTGKTQYVTRNNDDSYTWNLDPQKHILIFDEVHRCKNKDTLNSKMLVGAKKSDVKTVCLSATIADTPTQLYAVGITLGLFTHKFYNSWLRSLGGSWCEDEMRYVFNTQSLLYVNSQIFPNKGHRISVKELGNLFPETRILPDVFTVSEASQKRINDLYDAISIALGELRQKEKTDKGHHLTDLLRARQEIELIKVPVFVDLAQDALEENNSVVIIVNFTETLNALAQKLNTKCVVHGQQTAEEREKNIADFQADRERVIILNIRSGGVGVSLHDLNGNHPRVSLISPSWSAQDVVQAVGRVWRAGSKSSSIQKIVYCANTVEESICERMKDKIDNINKINEASVSDVFASLLPEEE